MVQKYRDHCTLFVVFSRPSNFTLGLGSNRVTIHVVDVTHTEPWILNTYNLYIHREQPGEGPTGGGGAGVQRVCQIIQVRIFLPKRDIRSRFD